VNQTKVNQTKTNNWCAHCEAQTLPSVVNTPMPLPATDLNLAIDLERLGLRQGEAASG